MCLIEYNAWFGMNKCSLFLVIQSLNCLKLSYKRLKMFAELILRLSRLGYRREDRPWTEAEMEPRK